MNSTTYSLSVERYSKLKLEKFDIGCLKDLSVSLIGSFLIFPFALYKQRINPFMFDLKGRNSITFASIDNSSVLFSPILMIIFIFQCFSNKDKAINQTIKI